MIPASFEYARARSAAEAVELLGRDEDAKLLAGGHSLIPLMRLRFARPSLLVDLGPVGELRFVRDAGDRIAIGALTRHAALAADPLVAAECAPLAEAARGIGDPQVRHRGTIGGSLAHGDPASDLSAVVTALDADLVLLGVEGERTVPASAFFTGMFETALGRRELVTEIRVPKVRSGTYLKVARSARDWATVGVAAARVDGETRIALTSMAATPLRARGVEEAVAGGASPVEAAVRAAEGSAPPSDVNGSAAYRMHLAQVLVRRALQRLDR